MLYILKKTLFPLRIYHPLWPADGEDTPELKDSMQSSLLALDRIRLVEPNLTKRRYSSGT